ncbi:MATE efflux family protein [Marvinbryantia formatexigens DSM 14469]|uniref:MATE efflux family protein n=1 Tax=Marvinbryantia formatexigens DSM 14469 TaxID=478749 RepID=C6LDK1_9FIRM|nr:MATE family efflux transporter [Marvinbryantia formatexigens]EET61435.1 MATE efflux family protein [Marvinbryantia formatexigens DSM 14469]UWO26102.1 MATE family efflux transporter [Marvinbryantia formatexigens DSM 14469]SDF90964.1 putative efflux protein, MATE family [Marvinbryantia formatexigens]
MEKTQNQLTEGNILKTLLVFAIPFLIANILQSLYGAVDLFVIGKYCDAASVAAVSTGTQVTQIVTSLVTGLTLGSTVIIGQYMGQKNYRRAAQTIGTTLTVFALVAILLTILMLAFERPLLELLSTPAESFELTMQYVAICAAGNLFVCGYNAISAILRGYGDSTRPMIFVAVACALNIFLDFVFVKYMGLGVSGTALATVISQAVSMVCAIIYLKKSSFIFDFKLKSFRPVPALVRELAVVGIPISFQELMIRISFLYLMTVMNGCGVYAAAVVGISSKYDVFAMLSGTSVANALAAITAHNIGAGKPERARRSLWYGLSFALCAAFLFWLWAQLSPQSMIRVFSDDEQVIAAGVPFFRSNSYDYLLVTIVFCLNGYLNGRQKTVWTMISSSAGALLLRIPLVYLFAKYFGDNLGMLGRIAPTVSGIMACYTLAYVLYEGRKSRQRT